MSSVAAVKSVLETELQDRRLVQDGYSIDLFFDTVDVRRAVLGMWDYVALVDDKQPQFELREFAQEAALVDALLAAGYMGPFRMLPPHQAEFLRHLQYNEHFVDTRVIASLPEEAFFAAIGVSKSSPSSRRVNIKDFTSDELEVLIRRHAAEAPRLFKAVQCVQPWWKRLAQWRSEKLFDVRRQPINVMKIAGGSLFVEACNAFSQARSGRRDGARADATIRRNDFADAVALLMLVEAMERFGSETDSHRNVPRFFDSSGTFRAVAAQVDVADKLVVRTHGLETPVLVDSSYFVHKASACATKGGGGAAEDLTGVVAILGSRSVEGIENLLKIRSGPRELIKVLDELQDYAFLRDVWLPMLAHNELSDVVKRLRMTEEERTQEFQGALQTVIKTTEEELRESTSDYQLIQSNWERVAQARRDLHEHYPAAARQPAVVRYFRLTRFSLPAGVELDVVRLLRAINEEDGGVDFQRRREWHELMRLYLNALKGSSPTEALVAAVILWCLNEPRATAQLLEAYVGRNHHFSIDVLYAAACFNRKDVERGDGLITRGRDTLSALMRRLDSEWESGEPMLRVDMCVGIAYLHFHLWEALSSGWGWRDSVPPPPHVGQSSRHLGNAIEYATRACDALPSESIDDRHELRAKRLYAQNQLLYYLLEQGDHNLMAKIQAAGGGLVAASNVKDEAWMYTFDDTLARYFHFLAVWSEDEGDWKGWMKLALEHIEMAHGGGPEDATHQKFTTHLLLARSRGFAARGPLRRSVPPASGD